MRYAPPFLRGLLPLKSHFRFNVSTTKRVYSQHPPRFLSSPYRWLGLCRLEALVRMEAHGQAAADLSSPFQNPFNSVVSVFSGAQYAALLSHLVTNMLGR